MQRLRPLLFLATAAMVTLSKAGEDGQPLDEVTVQGTRLAEIKREMERVEDRLFERYNYLNIDDEFDVRCVREAPLGARIAARNCRPAFVDRAREREAHGFIDMMTMYRSSPVPAQIEIGALEGRFRSHLRAHVRADPELRRLDREHARLVRQHRAEVRRALGRTPRPAEGAVSDPPAAR